VFAVLLGIRQSLTVRQCPYTEFSDSMSAVDPILGVLARTTGLKRFPPGFRFVSCERPATSTEALPKEQNRAHAVLVE
jgi:hypothetical protein